MPSRAEIVSFDDSPPPPGADPWASGTAPAIGIEVTDPDPALAAAVRRPRRPDPGGPGLAGAADRVDAAERRGGSVRGARRARGRRPPSAGQ